MGKTFSTGLLTNGIWQDASNNIGIGAAPSGSYKLEVTGTGRFTDKITSTFGSNGTMIENTSSTTNYLNIIRTTSTGANLTMWIENSTGGNRAVGSLAYAGGLCTYTSTALQFGTDNNIRMTITSGGVVQINNTDACYINFQTSGVSKTFIGSAGTSSDIISGAAIGDTVIRAQQKMLFSTNGDTERMRIYSTGGLNILNSTGDSFCIQFNSGFKLRADSAGQMGIVNAGITAYADLRVANMTKASGSFRISHPLESLSETHDLVHSFVEAPKADLIYRGKLTLVDGKGQANIDEMATMTEGTFELLCRDIQCFTTNESGWDLIKGKVIGNIIYIESQNPNSTDEISWMVIGERKDKEIKESIITDDEGNIIVEPLKQENSFKN